VVEPGGEELDLVDGHSHQLGELLVGVLHRVAEADGLGQLGCLPHRPRQHRHRVRVIEQVGVGAELEHVPGDRQQHRDRAQAAEHAAHADGVADRLPQPVFLGDLEVPEGGVESAHLDLVDDEVGAVEGSPPVEVRLDPELGSGGLVRVPRDLLGGEKPLLGDVVQDDRRIDELRERDQVGE
jgi:hypothetical protein